ncbi:MAG: glycosyltransferase [Rhodospirillales bacterium]|nr:glycosyltransferase [Rhodospirillales bacterium]
MTPLLLHTFPSFTTGGAQRRFVAVANRWGRDFRHAIVAMDGVTDARHLLDPGLDVTFPAFAIHKGETLGTLRAMRGLLRTLRPATLVTSNWGTIEWAIANRLPHVPHLHMEDGFGPEERDHQIQRRVRARRLLLRRARLLVPSRKLEDIARKQWRLDPLYVANGVDLDRFVPSPPPTGLPVVGTVAGLRPEKNVARLLHASALAARHVAHRLLVVGDGPEHDTLVALVRQLGLDAEFTGPIADPAPLYARMSVFALSSDTEQMPLSVLEAMAAGLPIAATAVGDVGAMVAEPNHPFLTARAPEPLADALVNLLADPTLSRQLGAANRARAEAVYDQETMFVSHAALWRDPMARLAPPT